MKKDTSWGGVAEWYEDHLKGNDTYHAKVIAPNLMRILKPGKGMRVLDIGCGEGYFTRLIHASGAEAIGADISKELIAKARIATPDISYYAEPAEKMSSISDASCDAVTCVLALQNMERLEPVVAEVARILKPGGRFVFVINHPIFRIPKRSSWGWDETTHVQYRRIDGYLSASRAQIDMAPGKATGESTVSFHRSLQDHMKALAGAGFAVTRLEEWISHKESEKGPRKDIEDIARKEFPLFLMIEAIKIA